jgi:hypothetical protein
MSTIAFVAMFFRELSLRWANRRSPLSRLDIDKYDSHYSPHLFFLPTLVDVGILAL